MKNERLWTKSYTCLIFANCLITVAYTLLTCLLPLFVKTMISPELQESGEFNAIAGSMAAGFGIVLMVSKPLIGSIIDRTNKLRFLKISTIVFLLNSAGYFIAKNTRILYALRLFNGLSNALFIISSSTLIANILSNSLLEDGIAYYRVTSSLTVAIAPTIANWAYLKYGFNAVISIMVAMSAAAFTILFCINRSDCPAPVRDGEYNIKTALKISNLIEYAAIPACFIGFFIYAANTSINNYLVSFGNGKGLTQISLFFTTNSIFMLLARTLNKKLSRKMNDKAILVFGFGLVAASLLYVPVVSNIAGILAAGAVSGLGDGLVTPSLNAMAVRSASANRKGVATATFSLMNGISTSVAASIWGKVAAGYGYPAIFKLAALSAIIGAALAWPVLRNRNTEI